MHFYRLRTRVVRRLQENVKPQKRETSKKRETSHGTEMKFSDKKTFNFKKRKTSNETCEVFSIIEQRNSGTYATLSTTQMRNMCTTTLAVTLLVLWLRTFSPLECWARLGPG